MIVVASGAFRQRVEAIEKMVASVGEPEALDTGGSGPRRSISFTVVAPGHGLPREATFEYRERYRRIAEGWLREAYLYEYRPASSPSRRAHHEHRPYGVHQHCRQAFRREVSSHYEDRLRSVEETHEDFERLYFDREPIRCDGLRPVRTKPPAR
jgi:hypothetical protein